MKKLATLLIVFSLVSNAFCVEINVVDMPAHKSSKEGTGVNITEAVNIALENNAQVVNALKTKQIYDEQVRQYTSYVYPSISLSGSYSRNIEKPAFIIGGEKVTVGSTNTYSAGADANWILYSGGLVSSGVEIAKSWRGIGYFNYEDVRQRITRVVTNTCYLVILSSALIAVQQEYLDVAKEHLSETEARYKAGLASSLDVLSQKVNVSTIEPKVIKAKNDYEIALLSLKQLLNKDPEASIHLQWDNETLKVPTLMPLDKLYSLALENRPELVLEKLNMAVTKEQIKVERANNFPTISAFANRYYNGQTENGFPGSNEYYWTSAVGAKLSWPIFEGFRTSSLIQQRKLAYEQAQNSYNDKITQVKIEVKRNFLNYKEAVERLKAGEGVVKQSKENVSAFLKRYSAGLASRLEVDEATSALNTAELQYIQAAYDAFASLADLRYSVGSEVTVK